MEILNNLAVAKKARAKRSKLFRAYCNNFFTALNNGAMATLICI